MLFGKRELARSGSGVNGGAKLHQPGGVKVHHLRWAQVLTQKAPPGWWPASALSNRAHRDWQLWPHSCLGNSEN